MNEPGADKPATAKKRRKTYSAPALEKGLSILELLADEPEGLRLSDIAKRLERSVGELFRMLVVLEQRGYVSMIEGTDTYMLTLKMFDLSHRSPPIKRLTSVVTPVMKRLSYAIGQSCHLTIYYEGKGHVIAQQDSPSERVFSVRLGAQVPLLGSCSGHILLAFADEEERQRMLEGAPAERKKPSGAAIKRLVRKIRSQGFEMIVSQQAQGVRDVGLPIFDYTGKVVAALVVPFVEYLDGSHKMSLDDTLERIKGAAESISTTLGL